MRWLRRAVLTLAALVAAYLLAAVAGAVITVRADATSQGSAGAEVLLIAGPIHYDILLPADPATRAAFGFAEAAGVPVWHPDVAWVAVGWGSQAFYTTTGTFADVRLSAVWRALTGDAAVIRIEALGPLTDDPAIRRVALSPTTLNALRAAILADLDGQAPLDLPGFSATDGFFAARGRFHAFATCNTWVSDVMNRAGLAMGVWTPAPYAVTLSLWWNGHLG